MIKFFRKTRQKMIKENRTSRYLLYAIGEIILVVIGILIALQINNWNETKKAKNQLHTNIISIKEDIQEESAILSSTINTLNTQEQASLHIIPVMESDNKVLIDSLKFILDFNSFTTTPILVDRNNTWKLLASSGKLADFPDEDLLKLVKDYYNAYDELKVNFNNTANPVRLQLRQLKYELFNDTEHRKFFPTSSPSVPNKAIYNSIFEDTRVLPLCRFIGSTATYFENEFNTLNNKALHIVGYIENHYYKNLE